MLGIVPLTFEKATSNAAREFLAKEMNNLAIVMITKNNVFLFGLTFINESPGRQRYFIYQLRRYISSSLKPGVFGEIGNAMLWYTGMLESRGAGGADVVVVVVGSGGGSGRSCGGGSSAGKACEREAKDV